jgi:hypothetical protein
MSEDKVKVTGLAKLREPFKEHQISKLPKPTKRQTEDVKADYKKGVRCKVCGAWHHPDVVHLDYVGHAALTDRLLDADPEWNWVPLTLNAEGTPKVDNHGGLWIKLTVCGITRLGYGHADGKSGGDAIKEVIGDALRNAAMRFGAALDLWHKGDLHIDTQDDTPPDPKRNIIAMPIDKAPKSEPKKPVNHAPSTPVNIDDALESLFKEKKLNEGDIIKACSRIAGRDVLSLDELTKEEKQSLGKYVRAFK